MTHHHQPPTSPTSMYLCDDIISTLQRTSNLPTNYLQALINDIDTFIKEIQTLRKFLDLIDRVRKANAQQQKPSSGFEEEHLSDLEVLRGRCWGCLERLSEIIQGARREGEDGGKEGEGGNDEGMGNGKRDEIGALRGEIEICVLGFQMGLLVVRLIYQWKSQLLQDSIYFHQKDLSEAIARLKSAVARRKAVGEKDELRSPVQEEGFLYDVEKCIFSAEVIMEVTTTTVFEDGVSPSQQMPQVEEKTLCEDVDGGLQPAMEISPKHDVTGMGRPTGKRKKVPMALPVFPEPAKETQRVLTHRPKAQNLSTTMPKALSVSDSGAKHRGSIDSDIESILDPEPEFEDCFPAAVYSELIIALQRDVETGLQSGDYLKAERSHRQAIEYLTDRERKLGIPFDNRIDMHETMALIYIRQGQLQKAKQILSHLLADELGDTERKWRLYQALAWIYHEQGRLEDAEKFAKRAYIGREKTLEKKDALLLESVNLLVTIYEQQHKRDTADALRRVYRAESILPAVPPKSKERERISRAQSQSQPSTPQQSSPPRIRWAPDVWNETSSINAPTKSGETPLISAIATGDDELVNLILQRGADPNARCVDGITPLMHAINHQHTSMTSTLLTHGADLEAKTAGYTALHRAISLSNTDLTALLLSHTANIEAPAPKEYTPSKPPSPPPLSTSTSTPIQTPTGYTPLHLATLLPSNPLITLLLTHSPPANIESPTPTHATPLLLAAESAPLSTTTLLLTHSASIHAVDDFGWGVLHRALVRPHPQPLLSLLLSHGADINARCGYGKTVLHHAIEGCRNGSEDVVCFLLENGADIEGRDGAGRTALCTAVECREGELVRLLLERGADVRAKDGRGRDVLGVAKGAGRRSPEIVALLERWGKGKGVGVGMRGSVGSGDSLEGRRGSEVSKNEEGGRRGERGSWWSRGSKGKKRE